MGLSVRFSSHLITIWHRESSMQKSVDAILEAVLEDLPPELRPKPDNYFYKKHADHAGFRAPPELQAVLDSQKRAQNAANAANSNAHVEVTPPSGGDAAGQGKSAAGGDGDGDANAAEAATTT